VLARNCSKAPLLRELFVDKERKMSLIHMSDVANAPSFKNRLIACIVKTAGDVFQEAPHESPAVANKRRALADAAMMDPQSVAQRFVWPMLSNPAIAAAGIEATDSDLEYQCAQVWNTVAGVVSTDYVQE
jgi:hypothetical protein